VRIEQSNAATKNVKNSRKDVAMRGNKKRKGIAVNIKKWKRDENEFVWGVCFKFNTLIILFTI
jgi:hypothetical protein